MLNRPDCQPLLCALRKNTLFHKTESPRAPEPCSAAGELACRQRLHELFYSVSLSPSTLPGTRNASDETFAELNGINAKSLSRAHPREGALQIHQRLLTERPFPAASGWQRRLRGRAVPR